MRLSWSSKIYGRAVAFALRLSTAALFAFWIARLLEVRLPLWVVLTAMIVTQTSLGRSLKVTLDYFAGTLSGALWGGLILILVPLTSEPTLFAALWLALAPLAFIAAVEPRFTAAPLTAAIVLLIPQMTPMSAFSSILERLSEVGLGGSVGLVVSIFLFPSSAFQHVRDKAADGLEHMAKAVSGLIEGLGKGLDSNVAQTLQMALGPVLAELSGVAGEADQERSIRLGGEETGPLFRSLLRLRHDLVMIGRAGQRPLPATLAPSFAADFRTAGRTLQHYFNSSATALRNRSAGPPLDEIESSITRCNSDVEAARRAGQLRDLSSDEIEHLFAIGFALEQMRRNLSDLKRCIDDWAG